MQNDERQFNYAYSSDKSKRSTLSNNINDFESELKKLQQQAEIKLNEERTVEIKLSKFRSRNDCSKRSFRRYV